MIKIICVGKIKEDYLSNLISDYYKRISKYHKINIIEVKDSNIKDEAIEINKYLNKQDYIICLCIEGRKINSMEMAKLINDTFNHYGCITFIIGGSDGIDNSIKEKANYCLSFSDLTFPHGLFRGILLEQIYRSFKINNNEKYHK